jgi:hypothetical protein
MRINDQEWSLIKVLRSFFPLHLLISHLKYNLISILIWAIFFLIISDRLGSNFGIPYLFLSPDYLGEVSPFSFLLLGFAIGGFIMGFNTYSYLKTGPHYPFLATVHRPFLKFCVNNSLIPLIFVLTHIVLFYNFQRTEELRDHSICIQYVLAYFGGIVFFLVLSLLYFFPVTRRSTAYEEQSENPIQSVIHRKGNWYSVFQREKDQTYIYIGKNLKIMVSRSTSHFDQDLFERVFAKTRINASLYEVLTILMFFILGLFNDLKYFEVPAGSSIILLFTIFLMLFSALQAWLKQWVYPILLFTFIVMNALSVHTNFFKYSSFAIGMDYSAPKKYNRLSLINSHNPQNSEKSFNAYIATLENWKKNTGKDKPKLILINTSGGGSRSALWTVVVLLEVNNKTNGDFLKQTQMMTGASGGMIGAAYVRSLLVEQNDKRISKLDDKRFKKNMGKDILNRMSFMASTNDIFIRYQKHIENGRSYTKDRGFAFEQQLTENTEGIFRKKLNFFKKYEKQGVVPTLLFTPTIVNDGRRMFIGAQNFCFLTENSKSMSSVDMMENVDFQTFFGENAAKDVRYTSVLRASATFPFVMPMITMPTYPEIVLMDAGIRDNYGTKTSVLYLDKLQEWISENTSGVLIVQIRDTRKVMNDEAAYEVSLKSKLTLPFGNMYKNFPRVQTFDQEEMWKSAKSSLPFDVDILTFNLMENSNERISLSWHLTQQEKNKVERAINSAENSKTLNLLLESLK